MPFNRKNLYSGQWEISPTYFPPHMNSTGAFVFNIILQNLIKLKCKRHIKFVNEANHIKSNIIFTVGTGVVKV